MVISLGWLSPATSTRPTRSSNDPGRVSLLTWPCSDWGLPCHACCQARGGLLPHRFTLTPASGAVCFLWPCPSPCGAQALPGSLPCGARTFLSAPWLRVHRDHRTLPPPTEQTYRRHDARGKPTAPFRHWHLSTPHDGVRQSRNGATAPAAAAAARGCRSRSAPALSRTARGPTSPHSKTARSRHSRRRPRVSAGRGWRAGPA